MFVDKIDIHAIILSKLKYTKKTTAFFIAVISVIAMGTASLAATRYVTSVQDWGPGTLRQALADANDGDTISFATLLPTEGPSTGEGFSGWVNNETPGYKWFRIVLGSEITINKNNLLIDATTCTTSDAINPGGGPVVEIVAPFSDAITIEGSGNTIKGFCINTKTICIWTNGSNTRISGNYTGISVTGEGLTSNICEAGVVLSSEGNIVGGSSASERNIISGARVYNIATLLGGNNTIKGNYVGITASGEGSFRNGGGIVLVGGNGNIVGGLNPGEGNVVSGCMLDETIGGIAVFSQFPSDGTYIYGNFVGTNISGTRSLPNSVGITVVGYNKNTQIGNGTPAGRNIVSGNMVAGLLIYGPMAYITVESTTVYGNYFGTDVTGTTALGNGIGNILMVGPVKYAKIGGSSPGQGNLISGNTEASTLLPTTLVCGIGVIQNPGVTSAEILGNLIGVASDGYSPLGNAIGIYMTSEAKYFRIGDGTAGGSNTIANNTIAGISIEAIGTDFNTISRNSIYANGVIGIRLKDGANSGIGTASISSVSSDGVSVTISGTSAVPMAAVEIFRASGGQGRYYCGTLNADASGNWSGIVGTDSGMSAGDCVTATQTDPSGNTSEFSATKETSIIASTVHHLDVTMPSTKVVSGSAFSVSVSIKDSAGNIIPVSYVTTHITADAGSVSPSSIDPGEYVSGVWTGNITLDRAGSRTLYFTYGADVASGTGSVVVLASTPATLVRFGPNPFDPRTGSGTFWYHSDTDSDTTIYLLDLSGSVLWKQSFSAGTPGGSEGVNSVTYDGRTSWGDILGNGVYIYKVVQGNRSIGGGKIAIFK